MNRKGVGTIEIIVLVASLISVIGGAWLGYDYGAPAKPDDRLPLVINAQGEGRLMEPEAGWIYDAMILPNGRIVIKEKP